MKLQFKKRRLLPVALAILVLVVGSGVAYAYWTSNGLGSGTGSTTVGATDILTASSPALAAMYPGDTVQTVVITVKNNSTTQAAYATQVLVAVTTNKTDCTADDFTLTGGTVAVGKDIAAGGTVVLTVANGFVPPTIKFFDSTSIQNACQNAAVTLTYTIS